jgi:hypothetical protein
LLATSTLIGVASIAQAGEPPPAPMHIGDAGEATPSPLGDLKSGFDQFGAAPKARASSAAALPAAADASTPPAHSDERLKLGQSGFPAKKWHHSMTARAQVETTPAPRLPGDHAAWQGAFRSAPVPKAADPEVVQTAGQVPLIPANVAMLPAPSTPDAKNDREGRPAIGPQKIEVPVTPRAEQSVVIDDSDDYHPKNVNSCASARDLKSINSITADISVKPGDLANSQTGAPLPMPPECSPTEERLEPRHWERTTFSWVAAATYHRPIYFDDDQLERYGHTFGPVTQSTVSAVKFFATVPLVPYYMGVYPPNECIYDLGLYRPGSCAPYYFDPFPLSVRGAINEGLFLGIGPAL